MFKIRETAACAALALAGLGPDAWAQQRVPDAGSVLREIGGTGNGQQPPAAAPAERKPASQPTPDPSAGPKTRVTRFAISGNTLLPEGRLREAVAAFEGRELTLEQMRQAAQAVALAYRNEGWVASATVAAQEVKDGVVVIDVFEAVAGAIKTKAPEGSRAPLALIESIARAQLPEGKPISTAALDRAILLAGDVPGARVAGVLAPGQADKSTDLILEVVDRPLWSGQVGVDNEGSRSTGAARAQGFVGMANAFGLGDSLALSLMVAEGVDFVRGSSGFPLGPSGLRGSAYATSLNYKLIGADFASLDSSGSSITAGAELAYPLWRSSAANANLTLGVERRSFKNHAGGAATSVYRMTAQTLNLAGSQQTALAEWPMLIGWSATLGWGDVDLNGSPNQASDASGPRSAGHYEKANVSANADLDLGGGWSLAGQVMAQKASKNLDSSEKMQLGGANGVRAYPSGEASGDEGLLAHAEATRQLGSGWAASLFYDYGVISLAKLPAAASADNNERSLRGAGLSVSWKGASGQFARVFFARRTGSNPFAQASGADQDGSRYLNRLWFTFKWNF